MANTYHQIYLQTIFAVKYRNAVLNKEWRSKLLGVIGILINEANCKTIIVNGVEDHVHVGNPALFSQNKEFFNELLMKAHFVKRNSSSLMNRLDEMKQKAINLHAIIKKKYHLK